MYISTTFIFLIYNFQFLIHIILTHTTSLNFTNMADNPNKVRRTTTRRLRRELAAKMTLANELANDLACILEQLQNYTPEVPCRWTSSFLATVYTLSL